MSRTLPVSSSEQYAPMEGWLEKESRHLGAWRSRYLILRHNELSTYGESELLSPTKPRPSECIPLLGAVCAATLSRGRRRHTFVVRSAGREVHFAATSAEPVSYTHLTLPTILLV